MLSARTLAWRTACWALGARLLAGLVGGDVGDGGGVSGRPGVRDAVDGELRRCT